MHRQAALKGATDHGAAQDFISIIMEFICVLVANFALVIFERGLDGADRRNVSLIPTQAREFSLSGKPGKSAYRAWGHSPPPLNTNPIGFVWSTVKALMPHAMKNLSFNILNNLILSRLVLPLDPAG